MAAVTEKGGLAASPGALTEKGREAGLHVAKPTGSIRKGRVPMSLAASPVSPQAGIDGEKEHASARKILLEMGEFFQVQVGGQRAQSPPALHLLPGDLFTPPFFLLLRTTTSISLETPV